MTSKHYRRIAKMFRDQYAKNLRFMNAGYIDRSKKIERDLAVTSMVQDFMDIASADNERFDRDRFRAATQL